MWPAWLASVAVSFVILELYAYFTGSPLLTDWVRERPWSPYVFGAIVTAMAIHFWIERE